MPLIIGNGFGGNDPEARKRQVTAAELESSGTLRWKRDLGEGWELSHFGHGGGRVMLRASGRYTTVPMAPGEADAALGDAGALAALVTALHDRIDSNAEAAAARRKKVGPRGPQGYEDPVDRLAVEDPAGSVIDMLELKETVRAAMREMTPKQAETWFWKAVAGYEEREIAQMRGVSVQAISQQYRRAVEVLRRVRAERMGK